MFELFFFKCFAKTKVRLKCPAPSRLDAFTLIAIFIDYLSTCLSKQKASAASIPTVDPLYFAKNSTDFNDLE